MLSSAAIKQHAAELGFDVCGISPARAFPELTFLSEWIARGYAGDGDGGGPARRPGGVAARSGRHAARRAGADQPQVPAAGAHVGVPGLHRGDPPPAQLRVGDDRRRQRPHLRCSRTGQAVPTIPASRPRQPDPPQSDPRLSNRWFTVETGPCVPRHTRIVQRQRHGSA